MSENGGIKVGFRCHGVSSRWFRHGSATSVGLQLDFLRIVPVCDWKILISRKAYLI